jgi:hypothetical protein
MIRSKISWPYEYLGERSVENISELVRGCIGSSWRSKAVLQKLAQVKLLENKGNKRLFLFEIGQMCYMFGGSSSSHVFYMYLSR